MIRISIHPTHPQPRLITKAAEIIHRGGVFVYPTDSAYALGCELGNRDGVERIRRIRQLSDDHHFTLVCRDLSELSAYAKVDNIVFRLLKAHTPGPYTFIMKATKDVPKRLLQPKRKTIGLRIPNHPVTLALLEELNAPILSVSLIMPGEALPVGDCEEVEYQLDRQIDLMIDSGGCGLEPTTVVDLTEMPPTILRTGLGDTSVFSNE